jgi:cytochrome c553
LTRFFLALPAVPALLRALPRAGALRGASCHGGGPWFRKALWIAAVAGLVCNHALAQTVPDTIAQRVAACTACHGKEGRAATDGFYPRIAGKPAGYLYNQLINFREGRRQYPLMIYMVDHLPDAYLREIAMHFSNLHPPYAAPQPVDAAPAVIERGRTLALEGDAKKNVPACIACHGQALTGVAPTIPGLLGLPRDYVSAQFGAWKNGARHAAAPDCMAQIAQRLSVADINAAAAWLAAQPVPADPTPAANLPARLPMACGSFAQATGGER